jgi:hypothetical protein
MFPHLVWTTELKAQKRHLGEIGIASKGKGKSTTRNKMASFFYHTSSLSLTNQIRNLGSDCTYLAINVNPIEYTDCGINANISVAVKTAVDQLNMPFMCLISSGKLLVTLSTPLLPPNISLKFSTSFRGYLASRYGVTCPLSSLLSIYPYFLPA